VKPTPSIYHRRRFPSEIISHCVWLYFRLTLSYRDIEEMMAARGVVLTYETVRDWSRKFGGIYAKRLRSKAARRGDHWHMDEVYLSINGERQILWRAVDQDGEVLDVLVQPRRDKQAAAVAVQ
jgi:putative transposase